MKFSAITGAYRSLSKQVCQGDVGQFILAMDTWFERLMVE